MKAFLIASLFLVQPCIAFAQNAVTCDSIVREMRFTLSEKDTETVFFYFNNEWIATPELAKADSIQKMEVKNDEYGNRAVFFTVSPEYLKQLKSEKPKYLINFDPQCEFPGGNDKFKEWLKENIRIPEGFKGMERVVVECYIQPDGTVTDPKISRRPSKNDAVNAEALRLVNALPKFRVRYFTPRKHRLTYMIPITFKEPGAVFIRGDKTE